MKTQRHGSGQYVDWINSKCW